MKKRFVLLALVAMLASGCATKVQKDWYSVGGSKSDATVQLGYDYVEWEQPIVSEEQAINLATQRCKAWGYASAEPFGGVSRRFNGQYRDGLRIGNSYFVSREFQCQ